MPSADAFEENWLSAQMLGHLANIFVIPFTFLGLIFGNDK